MIDFRLPEVSREPYATKTYNGVGRAIVDGIWNYVDYTGNVLPFDYMRGFDEGSRFCIVDKGGRYGIVNSDFEVILPLEYDTIFRAYNLYPGNSKEYTKSILYAHKEGIWHSIDLEQKKIASFDGFSKESTRISYSLQDFDILVYNRRLQYLSYYGANSELSAEMLLPAMDGLDFEIVYDEESISSRNRAKLEIGDYADELFVSFAGDTQYGLARIGSFVDCYDYIDIENYVESGMQKVEIVYCGTDRNSELIILYQYVDKSGIIRYGLHKGNNCT
jgi:hypothetical protein